MVTSILMQILNISRTLAIETTFYYGTSIINILIYLLLLLYMILHLPTKHT